MSATLKILLGKDEYILVDVSEDITSSGFEEIAKTGTLDKLKEKAAQSVIEVQANVLDKVATTVLLFSKQILDKFHDYPMKKEPTSLSLEYGLNFTAGADLKLANASSESAIKVVLTWNEKSS